MQKLNTYAYNTSRIVYNEYPINIPRIIHLITGYRRTGKDTLHANLLIGSVEFKRNVALPDFDYTWIPLWIMFIVRVVPLWIAWVLEEAKIIKPATQNEQTGWMVFSSRSNGIRIAQSGVFCARERMRVAFADAVKREVHDILNESRERREEPPIDDSFLLANKDMPIDIGGGRTVTMRDLYIHTATTKRDQDPCCWVARGIETIREEDRKLGNHVGNDVFDITDWRFTNELHYTLAYKSKFAVFTTRIFRNSVVVPESHIASEHDLDNMITDTLLVSSRHDAICALFRWPMYARYGLIGIIE